jgi:hypothetical protein
MGKPRAKSSETFTMGMPIVLPSETFTSGVPSESPRKDEEKQERFGETGSGKRSCRKRLESQQQHLQMLEYDKENWLPSQNEDSPAGSKQIKMD